MASSPRPSVADSGARHVSLPVGRMRWRVRGLLGLQRLLVAVRCAPDLERAVRQPLSERQRPAPAWLATSPPVHVRVFDRDLDVGERTVGVRVYRPDADGPLPLVVYAHGGGFVFGGLDTADGTCAALAGLVRAVVLSVDYRLAPEHRFPAPVDDVEAVLRWATMAADEIGADPARSAVAGDSAGGSIAAAVALRRAGDGRHPLRAQLLLYPCLDSGLRSPSMRSYRGPGLRLDHMRTFYDCYRPAGTTAHDDPPGLSPIDAEVPVGLAPAVVMTAGFDPLRDEGAAYVEHLLDAGIPASLHHFPNAPHGFLSLARLTGDVDAALRICAHELAHHLA